MPIMNLSCIRSQGAHRTLSYAGACVYMPLTWKFRCLIHASQGITTLPVKVDSFIQKSSVVECSSLLIKKHVHSVTWAFRYIGHSATCTASKLRVILKILKTS